MKFDEISNMAYVRGTVSTLPVYSHEVYGEGFYEFELASARLSNQEDLIPITISERFLTDKPLKLGDEVTFLGQFRSYNKMDNGRSKLLLTLFVRQVLENDDNKNPNLICLCGYVCKPCIYRTTPFNREIADLLLAVNRSYNKSDYIPCIAWGRNAKFCQSFAVGERIALVGRIQSRKYVKKIDDNTSEEKRAYEISVSKIAFKENINDLLNVNANLFNSFIDSVATNDYYAEEIFI